MVYIRLDTGEEVEALVHARSAADAGVELGNWIRRQRGIPEGGFAGIQTCGVRRVEEDENDIGVLRIERNTMA